MPCQEKESTTSHNSTLQTTSDSSKKLSEHSPELQNTSPPTAEMVALKTWFLAAVSVTAATSKAIRRDAASIQSSLETVNSDVVSLVQRHLRCIDRLF